MKKAVEDRHAGVPPARADEFRTLGNAVRIVIAPDTFEGSLPVACTSCNGETFLPGEVATDLDTEHGGTEAN